MNNEFKMPESVATVEAWTNRSYGRKHELTWQGQADAGESLYTSSDMRAVIERCAQICVNHRSSLYGLPNRDAVMNNCEVEIRKLLEQVK